MTRSKSMTVLGNRNTRKNMHTDRMSGAAYFSATKKHGAGKGNWGRPGDELSVPSIDEQDPAYDSADELFQRAFGTSPPSTSSFDWSAVQDLSDEDQMAMNEIEDAMREEWMKTCEKETEDISDEAEEFFGH
uniref:Hyaluronan/mRNA-binding protein domain-containing protein n=1 Tax=Hanusia phi TaxID=3032 RepID=A0A7S0HTW0_9CRYP|mmetsp:Transcript_3735/g.9223  ORF Transcript_3735/g.9223 Transcript_3735/m.9223 type:complete len:132 (+) Transcript_3735:206-601(+)